MEINRILFGQLNNGKVRESFEDLDVNTDGIITEADVSAAEDTHIRNSINAILSAANQDEDAELAEDAPMSLTKASASGSSARQTSRFGLPMTDTNTFNNDVLNSKGTVYVCIGDQYHGGGSFKSTEELIASRLSEIQKYANVYHLDEVNTGLVSDLASQAGINHFSSMDLPIYLKFVDGKLVGTEKLNGINGADTIINNSVGTPSAMPDVSAPADQNPNAPKNQYGVKTTNTANFQNDVLNSKGTVYVTIGNLTSCAYCKELQMAIQQNAQTLNAVATIYDLSTDTDKDLCWQIYRDMGGNKDNTMGLPQIAKFVDGKFVQIMSGRMATDAVSKMLKLAQGTAKKDMDGIAQTSAATFNDDVKNSKGTTYVMITSASGCQYCNILHNRMKNVLSQVQDKFGFYELATNEGADRDLCWQIYRDLGGGDGSSMDLPQIAKFVDGKFVELLSTTRDYGEGLDNVVIKEMLAKAEGTPVNNTTSSTSTGSTGGTSTTGTTSTVKTAADIKKAAEDLVAKYPPASTSYTDPYATSNPALAALKKALDGGAISELAAQGFSKIDIVDIISQAYPTVGIKKNNNGGYDCPIGHGDDAKAIYDLFVDELSKVKTVNPELLAKVNELNGEISANNAKLNELKASILIVQKEIETLISDAIAKSEEIQEDQKEEASKIVSEELDKYASSDGSITYDEFESSVANRLDDLAGESSSKLSSVVIKLLHAESKMATLKSYMSSFSSLVASNNVLEDKVEELKTAATQTTTSSTGSCDPSRCDPIGFSINGKRYDFFIDKDGNKGLTNENEFLGAANGWAEMKALDTDNDGKVSQAEMKDLKLVTTDDNGKQVIKDASEVFGATDSVDLNSYKSVNKDFANGNTLLGTFSMTVGGQEVNDAYNTMDKLSWLDETYDFTDEDAGTGRFAKDNTSTNEILHYDNDATSFSSAYTQLETSLTAAWSKTGFSRVNITQDIRDAANKAEGSKAEDIEQMFKDNAAQEEAVANNATPDNVSAQAEQETQNPASENVSSNNTDYNSSVETFNWEEIQAEFEENVAKLEAEDKKLEKELMELQKEYDAQARQLSELLRKDYELGLTASDSDYEAQHASSENQIKSLQTSTNTLSQRISDIEVQRLDLAKEKVILFQNYENAMTAMMDSDNDENVTDNVTSDSVSTQYTTSENIVSNNTDYNSEVETFNWEEIKTAFEENFAKIQAEDEKLEKELAEVQKEYYAQAELMRNYESGNVENDSSSESQNKVLWTSMKTLSQKITDIEVRRLELAKEKAILSQNYQNYISKMLES